MKQLKFPKQTLRQVGMCIYCGQVHAKLSEEHIVPYGLSGPWVLKEASCSKCAEITSSFERTVLKETLIVARTTMGLASRRPKKRPTSFSLSIDKSGELVEQSIPVEELTGTAVMLILEPPAYLDKRRYISGVDVKGLMHIQVGGPQLETMMGNLETKTVQYSVTFRGNEFERMLAKIGYGFAVAAFGVENFEDVYVLPSILGEKDDVGKWVGCPQNYLTPKSINLHESLVGTAGKDVHVRIRLFASAEAPWYQVIVGKLTEDYALKLPPL